MEDKDMIDIGNVGYPVLRYVYNHKTGLLEDLKKQVGIDEVRKLEWNGYIKIDDIDGWEITSDGISQYQEVTNLRPH